MAKNKKLLIETFDDFQSSNIKSFEYNNELRELKVNFHNGQIYVYISVPREALENVLNSDSIGYAFSKYIVKEDYQYTKIK